MKRYQNALKRKKHTTFVTFFETFQNSELSFRIPEMFLKHFWNIFRKCFLKRLKKMDQIQRHSFTLTETFQKRFINTCPWVNPYPYMGIHASGYIYTPGEPNWVLHGYLLHFAADKFSRTKVCDIYPQAERAFNFPDMAFFETKSKTGTKPFGNILETLHSWQCRHK